MMIIVARWTVKIESVARVLDLMKEMIAATRKESGNLRYDLFQNPSSPQMILIYEEYKDAEAIEAHRMSEHFQNIVVKQILPHLEERSVQVFTAAASSSPLSS